MVFESVVIELLNRYLKPYVKKLDTSQLKVGVWKGEACCIGHQLKPGCEHTNGALVHRPKGSLSHPLKARKGLLLHLLIGSKLMDIDTSIRAYLHVCVRKLHSI